MRQPAEALTDVDALVEVEAHLDVLAAVYLSHAMTTKPQLTGLLLPSREALLWADSNLGLLVDAAKVAEEAGYDSVWVGDSLLARPRGEPLALLGAIAGA